MTERKHQWELLTESERQFLKPLEAIVAEITLKYKFVVDGADSQAINDKMNDEFRSICTERNIDIKRAVAISTKLFNSPWYCYFLSDVETVNGEHRSVFSLCTSKAPDQNKPIRPDKNPAFYQAVFSTNTDPDTVYPAILKALKLSAEYKYLQADHYETLATVAEVFTDQHNGVPIPRIGGRRIKSVDFPLDKPNSRIWNMLSIPTGGQITFDTTRRGSKKEVSILYSIDFNELANVKISKTLDPFDKRVYIAVAALFNAGNISISVPQIYTAMGYNGTPGKADHERINNSITKMSAAHIYINNAQEVDAGYKYPLIQYDGSLLPMERVRVIINGDLVENAIHPFREPPMISLARGRKQITTIDRKLLTTPVNKTNTNLAIEDYLLSRITTARNDKGQKRILFSTLFKEVGLTTSKQQQRAKKPIEKLLKYYVECGLISKYAIDADGIAFSFSTKQATKKRKENCPKT